ncbi:MAG: tetratricopeptide repeat protein [Deltaproteobacteria bacterium]|nr:tetratricopeptide repeat protein [Deltaproteobacteria bacterium]
MDLGILIVAGVILLLAAPFLKGLMRGLRTTKGVKKTLPPEPLVEVKLVGLSDPTPLPDIELSRDFLTIRSLDFFGQGARSPNDRYMVGSQDSDYRGGASGGHRSKGYGRVVLLEDYRMVWQKDFERPNDAVVADNGTVAVNDWLFGDGLKGTFYIINRYGTQFGHHTRANLNKCGLSPDGALAWCTTLSNPAYEPDDCMTFVLSTSPAKLLFKVEGNLNPDEISLIDNEIHLHKKGITERYNFAGVLLNPKEVEEAWQQNTLEHGSPFELLDLAYGLFYGKEKEKIAEGEAQEIKDIVDKILKMAGVHEYEQARAYRLLGELAEAQGNLQGAIDHYRTALSYNPKVGVLRALSRLEKRLGKK